MPSSHHTHTHTHTNTHAHSSRTNAYISRPAESSQSNDTQWKLEAVKTARYKKVPELDLFSSEVKKKKNPSKRRGKGLGKTVGGQRRKISR